MGPIKNPVGKMCIKKSLIEPHMDLIYWILKGKYFIFREHTQCMSRSYVIIYVVVIISV